MFTDYFAIFTSTCVLGQVITKNETFVSAALFQKYVRFEVHTSY